MMAVKSPPVNNFLADRDTESAADGTAPFGLDWLFLEWYI